MRLLLKMRMIKILTRFCCLPKDKITPPFKAASAEFRDKLRFYVIAIPDKNPNPDCVEL